MISPHKRVARTTWLVVVSGAALLLGLVPGIAIAAGPTSNGNSADRAHARAEAIDHNDFAWPASGRITQNAQEHKAREGMYAQDIGNAVGTPVYAAFGGVVRFAGTTDDQETCSFRDRASVGGGGFGNFVVIEHAAGSRSYYTLYGHLHSWTVRAGQSVAQGTRIGRMGNTGCSTGAHTHFEISTDLNGVYPSKSATLWNAPDPVDGSRVKAMSPTRGSYPGLS